MKSTIIYLPMSYFNTSYIVLTTQICVDGNFDEKVGGYIHTNKTVSSFTYLLYKNDLYPWLTIGRG